MLLIVGGVLSASAANIPPTVTITDPASGSCYTPSAKVTVYATAADSDGSITKVDFYLLFLGVYYLQDGILAATDTGAPYHCTLSSLGVGSYSLTAKAYDNLGAVTTSAAVPITVASDGGHNLYFGYLHSHTVASDGQKTALQAYDQAKASYCDFLGLSDHSGFTTTLEEIKHGKPLVSSMAEWTQLQADANTKNVDGTFVAIAGYEWGSPNSHIGIFDTTTLYTGHDFNDFCTWIAGTNAMAIFYHPYTSKDLWFEHAPVANFVNMELWNWGDNIYYDDPGTRIDGFYPNDGGMNFYNEGLLRGWRYGAGGGEDAHDGEFGQQGESTVGVWAPSLTRENILNAYRRGTTYSVVGDTRKTTYSVVGDVGYRSSESEYATGKRLRLSFRMDGNQMGSKIAPGDHSVAISLSDDDPAKTFARVQLLKNGQVIETWTPYTSTFNTTYSVTGTVAGDYFYITAAHTLDAHGKITNGAFSSPIFVAGELSSAPAAPTME
jgi:hypothetical protein